jgi:RNA polymerase-binding transcription factor
MNATEIEAFRQLLLRQRQLLFDETVHVESDLQQIAEDRESELEEAAHEDRAARLLAQLDDRAKAELQEIERALFRIEVHRYGMCDGCGKAIPRGRLAAVPATPYCRDCAERVERGEPVDLEPDAPPRSGPVPPDYSLLTGRELEEAVREQVQEDGRVDMEELRIVCRRGVVYLDGSIPSEAERQILRHILTDVMGLAEIVDRLQAKEILWEREDRDREPPAVDTKPWEEPYGTEDIVESQEEGADFVAPTRPGPDEE